MIELSDAYKSGRRIVWAIAIYRGLIALVRLLFLVGSSTPQNLFNFVFNALVAIALIFRIKIAGYALAFYLIFLEIRWLIDIVPGLPWLFSDQSSDVAPEIADLLLPMAFLRSLVLLRGAIFIGIAAFVVYAMFFHKGVKEFFEVKKCENS